MINHHFVASGPKNLAAAYQEKIRQFFFRIRLNMIFRWMGKIEQICAYRLETLFKIMQLEEF